MTRDLFLIVFDFDKFTHEKIILELRAKLRSLKWRKTNINQVKSLPPASYLKRFFFSINCRGKHRFVFTNPNKINHHHITDDLQIHINVYNCLVVSVTPRKIHIYYCHMRGSWLPIWLDSIWAPIKWYRCSIVCAICTNDQIDTQTDRDYL